MTTGPDLVGARPLVGFRSWRVRSDRLTALYSDAPWDYGVTKAECRCDVYGRVQRFTAPDEVPPPPHLAPSPNCNCGLWVVDTPSPLWHLPGFYWSPTVWGAVAYTGRMEVYTDGVRAERAWPLALAGRSAHSPRQLSRSRSTRDMVRERAQMLERVASAYSLPVMEDVEACQDFAAQIGDSFPDSLRP